MLLQNRRQGGVLRCSHGMDEGEGEFALGDVVAGRGRLQIEVVVAYLE